MSSRMLKKSPFSPAQPVRAETRLFPCGMRETCEAYLVKRPSTVSGRPEPVEGRRSFPDSDVSRFTFHERQGWPLKVLHV